ncbi:hypothetical protein IKF74_02235 [Candidatus Saccharibacteria bacterium]|nr:hypothetical protein [Candidatus Saccharibacteria bacterium]
MRVIVVYKQFSDTAREVDEWLHEFEQRSGREVERLDPEMPDGEIFCTSRDIVEYPTIVVADTDGKTYETWSGTPLPVIDEVMGYIAR